MTGVDEPRLREALLRHLVRSAPDGPLAEMAQEVLAQEVLAGRMTLARAAGSLAYGDLFAAAATDAENVMRSISPAELAEAQRTLPVAASLLDPPVPPEPVRPRPSFEEEWDDSVISPWEES